MSSAIDCPTCHGRGYLLSDPQPEHNRLDPHCIARLPTDALLAGAQCPVLACRPFVTPKESNE